MQDMQAIITRKLTDALHPISLEVINESHLHAGHAGSPGSGQSHFRVIIISASFAGKSRIAMQQAVYAILQEEMKTSIHALSIKASAA
ncbi:MAG: BolA family protein [Pseudomonadota bacterium]